MTFTDDEIETIKSLICEWGSDCPNTDSDKVQELKYKLSLEKRPTPEEIAEQEERNLIFRESPFAKQMAEILNNQNSYMEKMAQDLTRDNAFFTGVQWGNKDLVGSALKIRLPKDYNIKKD